MATDKRRNHKRREECHAVHATSRFPAFQGEQIGENGGPRREDAILQRVKVHEDRTIDRQVP